jgi:hypothetical protein
MKFEFLLEELLLELSGKEIYQKYYSKIPYETFLDVVIADPKTKIDSTGELLSLGKYAKMLLSFYLKGTLKDEDLVKAEEYLGYVYSHNVALDINKLTSLGEIYELIKQYIIEDKKTLEEVLKALPENEYNLLFNGDEWIIYQPKTERASCYLGYNTEWCTTWGPFSLNPKHKDRSNRFQSYSKDGPLYIMINKKNPDYKFQFHFESNQYMDKDDQRINTKEFLKDEKNVEIFKFFFPSFYGDVSKEQIDLEFKRIDLLPDGWAMLLINKITENSNNPLVKAVISGDEEELERLISSGKLNNTPYIDDGNLMIGVKQLEEYVEEHYSVIGYYQSEADNGWEWVYNDVEHRGIDEYVQDDLTKYLEGYYEEKKYDFVIELGIDSFEKFHRDFFENYKSNDDIEDAFFSDITDLSYQSYEQINQNLVEKEKQFLDIEDGYDGYEIKIPVQYFVKFIIKKNIQTINDNLNWELFQTLDSYIRFYGLVTEFEPAYEYEQTLPKYGDNRYLHKETDKFFDKILDEPERAKRCGELRKQFNKIKDKYFKGGDTDTFENEIVKVRLQSSEIDCEKEMVNISYFNKNDKDQWGDTKKGWVKLDNLVSILTNYKLFESIKKQLSSLSSK